jgi:dephospho-CoA kinase
MIVLGLTGAIGMGKSTVAGMLRALNIPVFDADQYVHRALNKGGVGVDDVRWAFPDAYDRTGQKINRKELGRLVFKNKAARTRLEKILHPLVRAAEVRFIKYHRARGTKLVVLDIPLLFETGADALCDTVMCVSAPALVQRARVMIRPGMTEAKFRAIQKAQFSDAKKRRLADFVLDTGGTLATTKRDLRALIKQIKQDYARNRP